MANRQIPRRPLNAPPANAYAAKDFFTYGIILPAELGSGETQTGSFNLDVDSDFLWQKATFYAQIGGSGQNNGNLVVPGVAVTIKETSSGRDIMTVPVPLAAIAGTGQLPFILPTPKLLPANGTIVVTFSNITGDSDYDYLGFFFEGTKLFK